MCLLSPAIILPFACALVILCAVYGLIFLSDWLERRGMDFLGRIDKK